MTTESIDLSKFKYCECGCKELIPIINKKGKSSKFKKGHSSRLRFGNKNPGWKGGKKTINGYILILKHDHPYCDKNGYVYEHRLVMEEYIGRYLQPNEVIHHKDRNRKNNNVENLELFSSNGRHLKEELKIDTSDRKCVLCDSNTTYINKEVTYWYRYKNNFICNKCYIKEYIKKRKK